jgi:hypothetical protein
MRQPRRKTLKGHRLYYEKTPTPKIDVEPKRKLKPHKKPKYNPSNVLEDLED